jgi:hypothetical protein
MVAVGMRLLAERGLNVGLDTVRFDEAVREADAPRASAYRAWSDTDSDVGPQVRFHRALVAELLREEPGFGEGPSEGEGVGAPEATFAAVSEVLERLPDLASLSPIERGFWLQQIHRVGSNANVESMSAASLWRCYVAVAAGLTSKRDVPDELRDAWVVGEERMVERYRELYSAMAALFGLQLRYCYTWEQFDTAAGALAEGLSIRANVNPHVVGIRRATGDGGAEQDWTLFAVCFEALLRQFFEPIRGCAGDRPRSRASEWVGYRNRSLIHP